MKQKLQLLSNADNLLNLSQSTIDTFKLEDEMKQVAIASLDLFLKKNTNHFFYNKMINQIKNGFSNFDFVYIRKYPLPASFNIATKKGIINFAVFNRKNLLNVNPREIYTIILYCYTFSIFTFTKIHVDLQKIISEYLLSILMKVYAKKYGLVGTYENEIPKLKYLVSYYVNISFFDLPERTADVNASNFSSFKQSDFDIDFDDYDFKDIYNFIEILSDSNVFPGLNSYLFLTTMVNRLLVYNTCIFEDIVRFLSILSAASVNANTLCPVTFQFYNKSAYDTILGYIEKNF